VLKDIKRFVDKKFLYTVDLQLLRRLLEPHRCALRRECPRVRADDGRVFKELPFGPKEILGEFEILGSDESWAEKSAAVNRIVHVVTAHIIETKLLTEDMLRYLLRAWNEKAWENPNWLRSFDEYEKRAQAAGYEAWFGWIWEQWGWPQGEVP
jgi:hypothetical protein